MREQDFLNEKATFVMMHPSTKKLLDRLAEMTRQRRIAWQETSSGTGVTYVAEGYTVHLIKEPQTLQLSDANGTILEDVSSDDMASTQGETGQGYTAIFDEMLREASRQARGTERAIDTVLAGLDLDGDGIPDIPAPVQASQQPSEPTSDAGEYEDVADETGTVDAWGAVQPDEETGAAGSDAADQWTSPASPTYQAAADPQPVIQAEAEPAPATFSSETQPFSGSRSAFGSSSEATPHPSAETPAVQEDIGDVSETNVSEAVANMANAVNGGGQAPSAPAAPSGGGILGGGSFGTSGFGSFYSVPAPPQEPAPTQVDEPDTQASAAPEPEPAPTPYSWTTEPAAPSWQTVASAPAAQDPVLQQPVETTAAAWQAEPVASVAHEPVQQEELVQPQPAGTMPVAWPAQTVPRSEEQSAWTSSSEISPVHDGGHGSDGTGAYEDTPSGYTTHSDTASHVPAETSEPTESQEWSQGPAQADDLSTGFQGDMASDVTPDFVTPSPPDSTPSSPVAAQPVATETYAAPASFGQATEEATGAFASTAGSVAAEPTTAVDEAASAAEANPRSAWDTAQETTQAAASGVDEAARTASASLAGAAGSLMGAAGQAGQSVADTADRAATSATGAARSILGGAASQAAGAASSLAGGAGAAAGAAGQAIEGVANKLNPQHTLQREPASDGEAEGQNRQKPLTRFNPWS